jgi:mannose-6-phosphate isomerase-like protein (cupin superfamily)
MVVSKDTAEHYVWGGDCDGWALLPRQDLNIIHERMPSGRQETTHRHDAARQFFFVLSGELTMRMADGDHRIPTGAGLEIPPGVAHQAANTSGADVEFLVISHPTTRGDRVDIEG